MSKISFPSLSQVRHGFAEWRQQTRIDRDLFGLSDRCREDIGLRRGTGDFRPSVPWIP
jgi:uncharacterized protein YjiS (DUF1127 family)